MRAGRLGLVSARFGFGIAVAPNCNNLYILCIFPATDIVVGQADRIVDAELHFQQRVQNSAIREKVGQIEYL